MRKFAWAFVIGAALLGCGSNDATPQTDAQSNDAKGGGLLAGTTLNEAPDFTRQSALALLRRGGRVHVGDRADDAFDVFLQPGRAVEFSDVPPQIGIVGYKVKGWEASRESFGVISYQDRVALAMDQQTQIDEARVAELVAAYKTVFGQPDLVLSGNYVRYWLWRDKTSASVAPTSSPTRLMIEVTKNPVGSTSATLAVADGVVAKAFAIDEVGAKAAYLKAEATFATFRGRK